MEARLAEPLAVEAMARHAGYSPRSFARRFAAETGATPLQWLIGRRVAEAQRLLEGTDLPVEDVAARAGFGTAAGLRQHFARALGTSPTAYRRAFRGRTMTGRWTSGPATSARSSTARPPRCRRRSASA